jgi:hypothetical protein
MLDKSSGYCETHHNCLRTQTVVVLISSYVDAEQFEAPTIRPQLVVLRPVVFVGPAVDVDLAFRARLPDRRVAGRAARRLNADR